ncbi:TonB-dependent receptor [Cytophagales bacterium LB-30]|uniref:TonB-dependent receptor n=1 Tax=Shiella aurantiaca TaxID=3058365 RepID=A0ABT8F6F5_9BACT|nr:TonB-dependent receptor [Shiella aurantiaca]MDN4165888.1 TonB-dependent receptor [Shiella aurantiaca]
MYQFVRFFLFIALVGISSSAFAQKGFLRGKITDGEFGEGLFGATIVQQGTTNGVTTDFNGEFSLTLPAGTYTIAVSYVSYRTQYFENVEIKAGEPTILNATLLPDVQELDAVEVVAERTRDNESSLLTIQKKSPNVMDAMSSQSFKKIGDSNLAGAIKRVTGVSVEGGRYVYVRGLGDRYTKTTLNEMDIPGLDPDRNTVQIDIFPTNTLENIMVFKTFTPNLSADFTGGMVNVETKAFPLEKATNISLGFSYTPGMNLSNDFLSYKGGKLDFLGIDDGTRALPFAANTTIPSEPQNDPRLEELTRKLNPEMAASRRMSFLNTSFAVNHGNQKNYEKYTIGYNAVLNYQTNFDYYDRAEYGFYLKNNNPETNELFKNEERIGQQSEASVLWSALFSGAIKFDNHSISTSLLHTQNGIEQTSKRVNQDFDQNVATLSEDILTYTQRSITNNILIGRHQFNKLNVEWRNSFTRSEIDDPDFRVTSISVGDGDTTLQGGKGAAINRFYRNLVEINESFKADFSLPYGESSKLMFGGLGSYKKRDFSVLNYNLRVTNPDRVSADANTFLQEDNIWTASEQQGTYLFGNFEPANTYTGAQNLFGAYVMTEMQVLPKLRAVYGLRAEQVTMFYTGQNNSGSIVYDNEKTLNELNLLPSANLVYNLTEKMNLRGSFNKTLARPSFKEKSVSQIYDPISKITFNGNIDLTQTYVNNFDMRWEYFLKGNQMVAISGFYKTFDGHIELVAFEVAPENVKPRNAGQSMVVGAEIELRKNLDFFGSFFENLAVGTNLTLVQSAVDLKSVNTGNGGETEYDLRARNLRAGEELKDTRPMAGQSPYLVNAYMNLQLPKQGTNINVSYNVQGPSLAVVGSGRLADVYTVPFHSLNLNASQTFGLRERSTLTFGIQNLLNDAREQVYKSYGASPAIYSSLQPGMQFSLKYAFAF